MTTEKMYDRFDFGWIENSDGHTQTSIASFMPRSGWLNRHAYRIVWKPQVMQALIMVNQDYFGADAVMDDFGNLRGVR